MVVPVCKIKIAKGLAMHLVKQYVLEGILIKGHNS